MNKDPYVRIMDYEAIYAMVILAIVVTVGYYYKPNEVKYVLVSFMSIVYILGMRWLFGFLDGDSYT